MKEIEKIIAAYENVNWEHEKAALGTVVKVEESSYRRIGARIFVTSSGNWTGGISGGCLEGDALKRAQIAMNKNENSIVVYDTMDDDSHQIGVGLGCNGRIEVLFTPIYGDHGDNKIEFLKTIVATRKTEVLLQILSTSASNKAVVGAFYPLHKVDDLISDTSLSKAVVEEGIESALKKRKSRTFHANNDDNVDYEILVELIKPKIKVVCIGDNYDVNAFAGIAKELGWELHIVGKKRKISKELFELAHSIYESNETESIEIDDFTAIVLMSHDYKTDLTYLKHFINQPVSYIGLLGPRKRTLKMQDEWASEAGIDLLKLDHLYSPVGLNIGAETPEEIALAIAAEIIAVMNERPGLSLREFQGPIHRRD